MDISRRTLLGAGIATVAATLLDTHPADAAVSRDHTSRPNGPCAVIGDSLSLGAFGTMRRLIAERDFGPIRIDALPGRRTTERKRGDSGLTAIGTARTLGHDSGTWVIALGGNDFIAYRKGRLTPADAIDTIVDSLAGDPVAWLTIWHRGSAMNTPFNDALIAATDRHPNLHVVDWASALFANRHRWLHPDGVHLVGAGKRARAQWTADAAATIRVPTGIPTATP